METKMLQLTEITLDEAVQPRVELDNDHIANYVEDLQKGDKFPPVVVFHDGSAYWLSDGFHRYQAHLKAGLTEIEADIYEGGDRDAIMHAVGSNATHGKRRTNADKRKAVETLLKDDEWGAWSDRQIAEICRVSQPLVGKVRKEMTENGYKFSEKRMTLNGRVMDVTQIGSNRDKNQQEAEAPVDEASENVQQSAKATEVQAATVANPAADHSSEETPSVVNPEPETGEDETPDAVSENQSETPESISPDAGDQSEETAPSAEPETEVKAGGDDEATEEVSEETSPNEGDEALPEEPESALQQVDEDIPTLRAKITELQEALQARDLVIQEKDKIIEGLEAKILAFEKDRVYYERELEAYEREEIARERANKSRLGISEAAV
jgi:hypothetical protein